MSIDLSEILRLGEGQTVEFKKSLSLQRDGLEALCGMINADSAQGIVFFGIAPDSTVVGVEPGDLDKAQRSLAQTMQQKFDPPLIKQIDVLECEGWRIVRVSAQRSPLVAYHEYDGRAYIREGTTTRVLSVAEKQQLVQRRNRHTHTGPWRCDNCGSLVGTLVSVVLTDKGPQKSYRCRCGGEFWPA